MGGSEEEVEGEEGIEEEGRAPLMQFLDSRLGLPPYQVAS